VQSRSLGECQQEGGIYIGPRNFTMVRNFLLLNLNIRNANRAGILSELKVSDFEARQKYHN